MMKQYGHDTVNCLTGYFIGSKLEMCHLIVCDTAGRCCAIKVHASSRTVLIVNVYFPCQSQNAEYVNEVCECLGFIDSLLSRESYTDAVIIGDTNFE